MRHEIKVKTPVRERVFEVNPPFTVSQGELNTILAGQNTQRHLLGRTIREERENGAVVISALANENDGLQARVHELIATNAELAERIDQLLKNKSNKPLTKNGKSAKV